MKRTRYQEKMEGLNKGAKKKDKRDINRMMENFEKIVEEMVTSLASLEGAMLQNLCSARKGLLLIFKESNISNFLKIPARNSKNDRSGLCSSSK